ncbi:MAG TPA: ABC transporter permease [Nonomuraea sp.]|nr:ABC transporter permease [Nonomuraea sp.]
MKAVLSSGGLKRYVISDHHRSRDRQPARSTRTLFRTRETDTCMSVLASEWLKVRSIRSTYLIIGLSLGAILLGLALATTATGMYDSAPPERRPHARIADLEEVLVIVPQLCVGILGALAITSEYVTGLIRTTLTLVPRRWPVLAAKATIVGILGLLVGLATVFGTYAVSRGVIGDRFSGAYSTAFLDKLPLLTALSFTVPVFALLGLGLGALLRSTAGAIAILAGLVYVIPMIIGNIPEPWSERLGSLMIGGLPRQIAGHSNASSVYGSLLQPAAAAAVLAAYALLPLLAGLWLLRRRDV